jgi:hypothetical protein
MQWLFPTSSIGFRARLTSIRLDKLHLLAATERTPRIAVVSARPTDILVIFSKGAGEQFWGGLKAGPGQILILPSAHRTYWQTTSPIGWGAVRVPAGVLTSYGKAIAGNKLHLPADELALWQPSRAVLSNFLRLHNAAIRRTVHQPEAPLEPEIGHGLEQVLLARLIECLAW